MTLKAATELQYYIEHISGVVIGIVNDAEPVSKYEIILGPCNRIDDTAVNEAIASLDEDGFIIRTLDKKLIIAGGKNKGTLYGVYTFLEDYLDCRSSVQKPP